MVSYTPSWPCRAANITEERCVGAKSLPCWRSPFTSVVVLTVQASSFHSAHPTAGSLTPPTRCRPCCLPSASIAPLVVAPLSSSEFGRPPASCVALSALHAPRTRRTASRGACPQASTLLAVGALPLCQRPPSRAAALRCQGISRRCGHRDPERRSCGSCVGQSYER